MFTSETEWPLPHLSEKAELDRENAAWASGDYSKISIHGTYNAPRPGVIDAIKERWTGSPGGFVPSIEAEKHVIPDNLASLIAQKSARLLFSEAPYLTSGNEATQERLRVVFGPQFHEMLLEAAESAAIYGTVFLRTTWDQSEVAHAFVTRVNSDLAIPEYGHFGLKRCSFVKEYDVPGKPTVVRRLIETHQKNFLGHGIIVWQLFETTRNSKILGDAISLDTIPELSHLGVWPDGNRYLTSDGFPYFDTKTPGLTVVAVKNLPADVTAQGIRAKLGRSDFDKIKHRMARIDRLFAEWSEEIELGKSLLIVPANMLQEALMEGEEPTFNIEQRYFTPGPVVDEIGDDQVIRQITPVQPMIRSDEFIKAIDYFKRATIIAAGYSPASFQITDGTVALTATEVRLSQGASYDTQSEKLKRFEAPLLEIVKKTLALDALIFPKTAAPDLEDVQIEFGDAFQPDQAAISAQNAQDFQSQSASIETRVRRANPDKNDIWIEEEVARIREESTPPPAPAPQIVAPVTPNTPPLAA